MFDNPSSISLDECGSVHAGTTAEPKWTLCFCLVVLDTEARPSKYRQSRTCTEASTVPMLNEVESHLLLAECLAGAPVLSVGLLQSCMLDWRWTAFTSHRSFLLLLLHSLKNRIPFI